MSNQTSRGVVRWNWLMETFKDCSVTVQLELIARITPMPILGMAKIRLRHDQELESAFHDLGIKIKGTDPFPPVYISPMKDGAEEYDEVMAAEEIMNGA